MAVLNVSDALALEDIDSLIDVKKESLATIFESFLALERKLNSFLSDYKSKVDSLTDSINKDIDQIHTSIDAIEGFYSVSMRKIKEIEDEALKIEIIDNIDAKDLLLELKNKVASEIGSIKKELKDYVNSILLDIDKKKEQLNKAQARLIKLKDRSLFK